LKGDPRKATKSLMGSLLRNDQGRILKTMSGLAYAIEDSPEGRTLVVTGPWSKGAERVLARGEADGLILNRARGFCEGSLDLLSGEWPLRRLSVLDRSLADLGPIGRLHRLEVLSIQAVRDSVLDLGSLPALRSVNGEWSQIARTLVAAEQLENLHTWMFGEVDLHAFRDHWALRTLTVKDAPYLESLAGLGELPSLASLTIVDAPRLHKIEAVGGLSASLRELTFEKCGQIEAIDVVEGLVHLRLFGVSESGDIASLSPVESLSELETFYAWGSTRILDSDLSPLTRLHGLNEVRMRNRRGYQPPVGDLAASVS
jgi:hypothetical protein